MLFMAGSTFAPGQDGFLVHFNTEQTGFSGYGHSVREVDDGYVIFGHQVSSDPLGKTHCVIFKVDQQGDFVWRKELQAGSDYDYNFGIYDPIADLDTAGFACAVVRFNGADGDEHRLYLMNDQGDTVSSRVIVLPDIASQFGERYGSRFTRRMVEGGFLVAGSRSEFGSGDSISPINRALLYLLTPIGDTAWVRTYGSPDAGLAGYCAAEDIEGGYYVGGTFADGTGWDKSLLIRTDEYGEELWRRRFGGRPSGVALVRALPTGDAVTFCTYGEPAWPDLYHQLMLTRWDVDGNIVWQQKSHYGYTVMPGDLELLPDGSIITIADWWGLAQLAKFNSTGDSLWSRSYEVTNSEHNPYDVQITSDGGFIATGYAYQGASDPSPGVEVIWVLKTDSLGCVVPGCQNVGVQEYLMDLQEHLRVSPNPASDMVQIALDLPEGVTVEGQVQAHLQDATGRLVLQQVVSQNFNALRAALDVSALPAGTYYLHVRDARRWLAGSKFIVQ